MQIENEALHLYGRPLFTGFFAEYWQHNIIDSSGLSNALKKG